MPSFVKTAVSAPGRARLRHEAAVLARSRHPGVAEIAAYTDDDGTTRLELIEVAGPTLAETPPSDPRSALRVIAATATTVADLHELGVAHRRLTPDHVLLDAGGRPVLCGFAEATDRAQDDDRRLDTTALASLVELLAVHARDTGRPTRPGRALRNLAADARTAEPPMSPAALARRAGRAAGRRAVAAPTANVPAPSPPTAIPTPPPAAASRPTTVPRAGLPQRVPTGATVRRGSPRRSPRSNPAPSRARRTRTLVSLGAVPVVVVAAVIALGGHAGDPTSGSADAAPATATAAPGTVITTTTATAAPAPGGGAGAPAAEGPVRVRLGDRDYEAGQTGDQVIIADWTCTGVPAAALLRPATGEVFLFTALPDVGETVTSQLVTTVRGARQLVEPTDGPACPSLAVRDADGRTHQIGAR